MRCVRGEAAVRGTIFVSLLAFFVAVGCGDQASDEGATPPVTDTDVDADGHDATPDGDADLGGETGADADAIGDTNVEPPDTRELDMVLPPSTVHRLTRAQFAASVSQVFGPDLVLPTSIEPDVEVAGLLALGAAVASVSTRGVEQYESAAFAIAEQAVTTGTAHAAIATCAPTDPADEACARAILDEMGLQLWRRPLVAEELDALVLLHVEASTVVSTFEDALVYPLAALLQSPHFLYRIELGVPDPNDPERLVFTDWELASRLSFLLWNTAPDLPLLEAAARGELTDVALLEGHVDRMLDDPRLRDGVRAFFGQMLHLHHLDAMRKDPNVYDAIHPDLIRAAQEETLLTIERHVVDHDADYRELFTTRRTYVNRRLATLYDIPAPAREGFAEAWWPEDSPRRGLLGQFSVLALHAHPVSTSPTLRGLFVREVLLCSPASPPPAGVDTSLPEPSGTTRTMRERVQEHLTDPDCAACHMHTDPIGLALEHFDGIGRFRTMDNGATIDASGELDGVAFDDAVGLAEALANHPRLAACLVSQTYRYATGHVDGAFQRTGLNAITAAFTHDGYRVRSLLRTFVLSSAFRYARVNDDD